MSCKILIVEDDMNYRFVIKKILEESEIFTVVGEAIHGKQALEILEKEQADMVLTDMDMPVMNGVELTRKLVEKYPDMVVVALSAYDDFTFVKESMKLGAKDYVLKWDIEDEKLIQVLNDVWQKYKQNRQKEDYNDQAEIYYYLTGGEYEETSLKFLKEYLDKSSFWIGVHRGIIHKQKKREKKTGTGTWICLGMAEETVVLFKIPKLNSRYEMIQRKKAILDSYLESTCNKISMGISDMGIQPEELSKLYRQAKRAESYSVYLPGVVLDYMDTIRYEENKGENGIFILADNILIETKKDMKSIIEDFRKFMMHFMPEAEQLNQQIIQLYIELTKRCSKEVTQEEVYDKYEKLKKLKTLNEKLEYLDEELGKLWSSLIYKYSGVSSEIKKAVLYIQKHYAEQITLKSLSDYVGLSENYFSNLFKAETGENVTFFINKVRIENAKRLMFSTNKKMYEISQLVGYQNPTYFSTMFKKITSYSISEYKKTLQ